MNRHAFLVVKLNSALQHMTTTSLQQWKTVSPVLAEQTRHFCALNETSQLHFNACKPSIHCPLLTGNSSKIGSLGNIA